MKRIWIVIIEFLKKDNFKYIVLLILTLLSLWAILAIQFSQLPVVNTSYENNTVTSLNTALLTLSYSYIAALVFYLVTIEIPAVQRKIKLKSIIKRRVAEISSGLRDILLEFSRGTKLGFDVHDTTNTKAILQSKDWMTMVPHIQMYRNLTITYLRYMNAVGDNMKSQISNLIARYHSELTPSQLVELENLSDAQFLHQIEFLNSIANIQMSNEGRDSLIDDFIEMQKQYVRVEKEFGITY